MLTLPVLAAKAKIVPYSTTLVIEGQPIKTGVNDKKWLLEIGTVKDGLPQIPCTVLYSQFTTLKESTGGCWLSAYCLPSKEELPKGPQRLYTCYIGNPSRRKLTYCGPPEDREATPECDKNFRPKGKNPEQGNTQVLVTTNYHTTVTIGGRKRPAKVSLYPRKYRAVDKTLSNIGKRLRDTTEIPCDLLYTEPSNNRRGKPKRTCILFLSCDGDPGTYKCHISTSKNKYIASCQTSKHGQIGNQGQTSNHENDPLPCTEEDLSYGVTTIDLTDNYIVNLVTGESKSHPKGRLSIDPGAPEAILFNDVKPGSTLAAPPCDELPTTSNKGPISTTSCMLSISCRDECDTVILYVCRLDAIMGRHSLDSCRFNRPLPFTVCNLNALGYKTYE